MKLLDNMVWAIVIAEGEVTAYRTRQLLKHDFSEGAVKTALERLLICGLVTRTGTRTRSDPDVYATVPREIGGFCL